MLPDENDRADVGCRMLPSCMRAVCMDWSETEALLAAPLLTLASMVLHLHDSYSCRRKKLTL